MVNTLLRVVAILLLSAATSTPCPAQKEKGQFLIPIPEKLERAVTTDEAGLQNWAPFKAEPCVNCKGKKTMTCLHCARVDDADFTQCPECNKTRNAPCRVCFGTGETWDILQKAPCPTCFGAAVTACFICSGEGQFKVEGGGKKKEKCLSCDGLGAYKCQTCAGKRHVELPAMKPPAPEGRSPELKKALEAVALVAAALEKSQTTGDGRKDLKVYNALLAPGGKYLACLTRAQKHIEDVTKKQSKGAVWKHYPETVQAQFNALKQSLDYYLKHQKRVLELCLARAEHNEPLQAQKKK